MHIALSTKDFTVHPATIHKYGSLSIRVANSVVLDYETRPNITFQVQNLYSFIFPTQQTNYIIAICIAIFCIDNKISPYILANRTVKADQCLFAKIKLQPVCVDFTEKLYLYFTMCTL